MKALTSKLSSRARTVIPREVRERLGLNPGDRVRYRVTESGVVIDKDQPLREDPFAAFTEWGDDLDERAFEQLQP